MHKTAFITGATAGFGKAMAVNFAKHGYRLILNGRRKERLEALADELQNQYKVEVLPLAFDVRVQKDVRNYIQSMAEPWRQVDVLINNAGGAKGMAPIQQGALEDWEFMIDTNVKGLLYVSKEIMPWMIERKSGHIVNIGSVAGKEVYANGNVYCAAKHAVDAITKSMRIDLLAYGIKVTGIHPGLAETEFSIVRFHGDTEKAKNVYKGLTPLYAEDIADIVWYVVNTPPHVCINDLIVTPTAQANAHYTVRQ